MKHVARLHYVTHPLPDYPISRQVEDVCKGGCRWVQLRMKSSSAEERVLEAVAIQPTLAQYGAKLIVNDDVFVAKVVNADGVHIGKDDMDPSDARRLLGSDKIIGCTANTVDDVLRLCQHDIDYIGLGPFRFTATKAALSPVLGTTGIAQVMAKAKEMGMHIPIIAIGGIVLEDFSNLMSTGIHGVAVSGGIRQGLSTASHCKAMITKLAEQLAIDN